MSNEDKKEVVDTELPIGSETEASGDEIPTSESEGTEGDNSEGETEEEKPAETSRQKHNRERWEKTAFQLLED